MNKKVVVIVVVILLIMVIGVVAYFMTRPKGVSVPTPAAPKSATSAPTPAAPKSATSAPTPTVPAPAASAPAAPTPAVAPPVVVSAPMPAPMQAPMPAPMPAPEVPYNRVQYVRIQRVSPHPAGPGSPGTGNSIQVSEIEFFDTNGNKIVGKIQNASYNDGGIGFNPFAAVNSNIAPNDFAHTTDTPNAHLQIAFTEPLSLGKIVVSSRDGFQYRMIGTEIQTFPAPGPTPYTKVAITTAKDKYTINYTPNNLPTLSSEPFSFITSLPQYLRHLQNKNYLL